MEGLERILGEHRLFVGLPQPFVALAAGCARNVAFNAGDYLFRSGDPADWIYLVRHGHVALEAAVPGRGAVMFETVSEGDVAGLTWLLPPYRWDHDARAIEPTRALALDATCLRNKWETDHDLGCEVLKRFLGLLVQKVNAARFQVLDIYARHY
ncbi:cyclic nucleotide-binding domain-containing protein [Rhodopila globiformis]|uniref:Crp/Fnr family transcriptional regulator n=1 Tax=Rhodopila globiformis TaxID=1071 RepID=A0A2S6N085_RHOGL|nr:cyclic nucleotide-binding domain-containing protein [Rhodopila globiformis]PPQ28008.1 Crp/Fnr family transcriptional regulator [Rhodopila globiformis]